MTRILVYGVSNGFGGIESFFINLITHMDKSLIFDFVTPNTEPCSYEAIISQNKGKRFAVTPWGVNPKQHRNEMATLLTNNNYDFVWVNTSIASNLSIYRTIKKYSESKIIVHSHGSGLETRHRGLKRLVIKLSHHINKPKIKKVGDLYFASSKKASKWLFGNEMSKSVKIIKNGIELDKYQYSLLKRTQLRKELGIVNKLVVGHIGRFSEVKNHHFLIDILKKLIELNPNTCLCLIGSGKLEEEIKQRVNNEGLEKYVKFLGYIPDVNNYLQAIDVFVLPSLNEGLSIATIEAQAAGIPSVVSDVVPNEVSITPLVEYVSLNLSSDIWASKIISQYDSFERTNQVETIKRAGFDIQTTVEVIRSLLCSG